MAILTVREALKQAMEEEMLKDESIILMGEEVGEYQGAYKVSEGLIQKFGSSRVIDTPISEHGFAGIGVGAAFSGLRPIVEFMSFNFSMQAIDQVINSAAKTRYMSGGTIKCPIVFRGPNGAAARVGAQHSQCYASWYAHIPGLKVISPYSAYDAKGLLKSAIKDDNPVIFLEHELLYGEKGEIPEEEYYIEIGKAKLLKEGNDLTIVSFSMRMKQVLEAGVQLENDGITADIIDLRTLKPLDIETILISLKKTNRLIIVEEGWGYAGIASEIIAQINERGFDYLDAPVVRITAKDIPLPYAANLERLALPQVADIVESAKKMVD